MTDPEALSGQMLQGLARSGELTPAWAEAFAAVPRHRFIPDTIWIADDPGLVPLHRAVDPCEWMRRAYGPSAVITQVDDRGVHRPADTSVPPVAAHLAGLGVT